MRLTKQERWIVGFLFGALVLNVGLKFLGLPTQPTSDAHLDAADSLFLSETNLVDSLIRTRATVHSQTREVRDMTQARQQMLININTASADWLQHLPGIGPVMAKRIIAHREKNGYFTSIDDLQQVRGIGPVTASKIEPYITFEP